MKKLLVSLLVNDSRLARVIMYPLEVISCLVSAITWGYLMVGVFFVSSFFSLERALAVFIPILAICVLYGFITLKYKYYIRFHFFREGLSKAQIEWLMQAKGAEFHTRYGLLRATYLGLNTDMNVAEFDPYASSITDEAGNLTSDYRKKWISSSGLGFASLGLFAGSIAALDGIHDFYDANHGDMDIFHLDSTLNDMMPTMNIDGTPMVGGMDIHGNPYGITSDYDSMHSGFDHNDFGEEWAEVAWGVALTNARH